MPGGNADGGPQVELRDLFALLFAALCGLLLGVAAAPVFLPMLGFAGFTQPYIESRTSIHRAGHQGNGIGVAHVARATAPATQVTGNRSPSNRSLPNRSLPNRFPNRSRSRRPSPANQPEPTGVLSPLAAFSSLQLSTLIGLGTLFLVVVLWLRRDIFAVLLCRWAKDPRQWRGTAEPALVNAQCVLQFEGNAYRLGAEFFTQAVEVRYSPLFVRINMRGSDRSIILPRRVPKLAAARRSSKRRSAAS